MDEVFKAAGGRRALAVKLGLSVQAVHSWKQTKKVPAERVMRIEKLTGIPRSKIRPDLYPPARERST
jgi:DNA-binding transcriptional regulator YdaS (Cro superfamily)